jgi:transposase
VAEPDKIERHEVTSCEHCQAALTAGHALGPSSQGMAAGVEKRQVFDMPEPRLEVTGHQAHIYTCACCRGVTKAAFPPEVTVHVQYGPRIKAAAIYLNTQQLVPEDRVGDIMKDLFGAARLCPASIVAWGERKAEELTPVATHIADLVAKAPVRNLDETGFRVSSKTQWLHSASTAALTHYRVSEKRGALWKALQGGIIVHDHFKPYFTLKGAGHALCNAHHLRELKALTEIEKEPWATKMSRLLLTAARAVRRAVEQGQSAVAAPSGAPWSRAKALWPSASRGASWRSTMRSYRAGLRSMNSSPRWSGDPERAASQPNVRGTICWSACVTSRRRCCGFCPTSPFPSPTIRPNKIFV